jgi:hypothetical protein
MDIEEALTAYLLAQSGLTALIARRLYFDSLKLGTDLPAVVCINISDVKLHTLTGQYANERPMYQFSAYGSTRAEARAVANQLKTALIDYHGTLSGVVVNKIELQNELSSQYVSADGTTKTCIVDLEFEVSYERS